MRGGGDLRAQALRSGARGHAPALQDPDGGPRDPDDAAPLPAGRAQRPVPPRKKLSRQQKLSAPPDADKRGGEAGARRLRHQDPLQARLQHRDPLHVRQPDRPVPVQEVRQHLQGQAVRGGEPVHLRQVRGGRLPAHRELHRVPAPREHQGGRHPRRRALHPQGARLRPYVRAAHRVPQVHHQVQPLRDELQGPRQVSDGDLPPPRRVHRSQRVPHCNRRVFAFAKNFAKEIPAAEIFR